MHMLYQSKKVQKQVLLLSGELILQEKTKPLIIIIERTQGFQ